MYKQLESWSQKQRLKKKKKNQMIAKKREHTGDQEVAEPKVLHKH